MVQSPTFQQTGLLFYINIFSSKYASGKPAFTIFYLIGDSDIVNLGIDNSWSDLHSFAQLPMRSK
jgi:hypothetical protein